MFLNMPKQGKHIDQDIEPDVIFNGRDALRGKYRRIYAACIFKMKKKRSRYYNHS